MIWGFHESWPFTSCMRFAFSWMHTKISIFLWKLNTNKTRQPFCLKNYDTKIYIDKLMWSLPRFSWKFCILTSQKWLVLLICTYTLMIISYTICITNNDNYENMYFDLKYLYINTYVYCILHRCIFEFTDDSILLRDFYFEVHTKTEQLDGNI